MKRLWTVALGATLLAACRIEQTPADYIDHGDPIDVVREAAVDEIHDRILAVGQALDRDDPGEALIALAPAQESYFLLPGRDSALAGPGGISQALRTLATDAAAVEMRDVQVTVGPRANIAWFRAALQVVGTPPAESRTLQVTGVYVLDEGLWELVQAHLSAPVTPAPPSSPAAESAPVEGG